MERQLEKELTAVKEMLLRMAGTVETMVDLAVKSVSRRSAEEGPRVEEFEGQVNRIEVAVDEKCIATIALHQPAAADLRFLVSAMKINNNLERMADQAVNVMEDVAYLVKTPVLVPMEKLERISTVSREMVKAGLDAFVNTDTSLARSVFHRDDEVDTLKAQILREIITGLCKPPQAADQAIDVILIARNFERIADLATNIAEEVIFIVLGEDIRHHGGEEVR